MQTSRLALLFPVMAGLAFANMAGLDPILCARAKPVR
jgi:hypothetical protein